MRVIWVNRSEWRKPGPIVYIGLLNAHSFAVLSHPVDFYCGHGPASETEEDLAQFYGVESRPEWAIHRIPPESGLSKWRGRAVYREAIEHAERCLKSGEQVLFLTRELSLVPRLGRLQRRYGERLRTLYEAHDFHADLSTRAAVDFNDRRKQVTERFFLPGISGIVAITSAQADRYEKAIPRSRVIVAPLGCLPFPAPESPEVLRERRSIAYIGHLHREKGVPQLLAHEKEFSDRGISLKIIGGDKGRVDQLRKKLKLSAGSPIEILPSMPPAKLHPYLASQVGAGLVPLEDNDYNRYLTCPVKALDSMAHHLPVVASDLPSTREVLGEAGSYVAPGDGEGLLGAITTLFDQPERFAQLSRAAGRRATELAWPTRAQRIFDWAWRG